MWRWTSEPKMELHYRPRQSSVSSICPGLRAKRFDLVPVLTTVDQLALLCNQLLERADDPLPISFQTSDGIDIKNTLLKSLPGEILRGEKAVRVIYLPQAVFRFVHSSNELNNAAFFQSSTRHALHLK